MAAACSGYTGTTRRSIGLPMRFSVYLPPQASSAAEVPALFYLAGLTCTEETFPIKAGAQRYAAEHGIALISPDTSPRGAGVANESAAWDFGVGAGFYVDATAGALVEALSDVFLRDARNCVKPCSRNLPLRRGPAWHLRAFDGRTWRAVLALRNPDLYRSVSAFAPIAAPSRCPVGCEGVVGISWRGSRSVEAVMTRVNWLGPLRRGALPRAF